MVYLRCTDAPARIPWLPRDKREKERAREVALWVRKGCRDREGGGGGGRRNECESESEPRQKRQVRSKGPRGDGKAASSSSGSCSRSRFRDKLLLMEEINFGLNRSPATL